MEKMQEVIAQYNAGLANQLAILEQLGASEEVLGEVQPISLDTSPSPGEIAKRRLAYDFKKSREFFEDALRLCDEVQASLDESDETFARLCSEIEDEEKSGAGNDEIKAGDTLEIRGNGEDAKEVLQASFESG